MSLPDDNQNPTATSDPDMEPSVDWGDEAFAAFASDESDAPDAGLGEEATDAPEDALPQADKLRDALALLSGQTGVDANASSPVVTQTTNTPAPVTQHTSGTPDVTKHTDSSSPVTQNAVAAAPAVVETADARQAGHILPAKLGTIDNTELAEAYLQDASRGVASMEQATINYESQTDPDEALAQILRELHTLKGASAITGLTDLARYLHDVEDLLQKPQDVAPSDITETMLQCIETVRSQVDSVAHRGNEQESSQDSAPSTTGGTSRIEAHSDAEDSICVKASQLDRLMDMLAALVMLRNQRESRVENLRCVNEEVARCGSRLREIESQIMTPVKGFENASAMLQQHSDPITEVANDLLEISRTLRESYEPVAEENLAVSSFIRQFRQALVKLLRMPVSGLFRRLQRAALDAARVEKKRVRLQVVGSDTGLERSIQERLYDPLLHIVRNGVSHGIESPEVREQAGKDPVGTITLEATGTPNLLIITVRDDGRGLDYEALRRRGIELGILTGDRAATPQELAQLIFRPGFSTRKTANEIAGRGVGMDVVAHTLDRMHSWVEVDSNPGQGTVIRLTVPLRSIIEHTMVFRAGEQLFAVPMQYIKNAGAGDAQDESQNEDVCSLSQLLGVAKAVGSSPTRLVIEAQPLLAGDGQSNDTRATISTHKNDSQVMFQVDEILGPDEVVVRPLPPLFRHQTMFAGVTLSGHGQIVLVLDPRRLISLASHSQSEPTFYTETFTPAEKKKARILVVDDSLSARRSISLLLRNRGWEPVEASDGLAAVEQLDLEEFAAVFTDFDMPRMDGLQLIRTIRERPELQTLPIIMVSSRSTGELEEKATDEGASCYLKKPITETKLDEILNLISDPTTRETTHA